jgi:hypothetical protein
MNLIYQYFIPYTGGDSKYNYGAIGLPEWAKIGKKSAEKYAKAINAEYMFSDKIFMHATLNVFESFRVVFDPTFDKYDNVLVLDIDTIVNTTDNIFDIEVEEIGMVHELGCHNRTDHPHVTFNQAHWNKYFNHPSEGIITYAKNYLDKNFEWQKSEMYPDEPFALYNGGLQLWSKKGRLKARELFKRNGHDHFRKITGRTETPYINMMLMHHKFKITELPIEWNKLNFQWGLDNDKGKITHYNDVSKNLMLQHG